MRDSAARKKPVTPISRPPANLPKLSPADHRLLIDIALKRAELSGRLNIFGPKPVGLAQLGVYSLAQWQSPFRNQGDRGTCWAFAGAAALEAAYRRAFNSLVHVSEEYVFHMGKAFALEPSLTAVIENNSSLTGFQGSGDIVQKLTECAAPPALFAPYYATQAQLEALLPQVGIPNIAAVDTQEECDALEFCEQHIALCARVNARYRATGFTSLGGNPGIEALENTILANHEVVCDVNHVGGGGHVLLLVGFDRNRRVFQAKNSWGENAFIEIHYENDPTWTIHTGYYIHGVVDPTYVQLEPCWVGNWWVTTSSGTFRLLLRRTEDFRNPGKPTRLGSAYLADGRHDVNGHFEDGGRRIRLFIAGATAHTVPGTETGTALVANLNFKDLYNATGSFAGANAVLSRYQTRFAAVFEPDDGTAWVARHGIDPDEYQQTFDQLVAEGYRLTSVCGYSEGLGSRLNAVWQRRGGPAWQARHGLTGDQYQAAFDDLAQQGYRLVHVSGYSVRGTARYAGIWEQSPGPEWQARHGMSGAEYQSTFDQLASQGYRLVQVCGYRVNVSVLFAAIWEKRIGPAWTARHGLTSSEYQKEFNAQVAAGKRLVNVCGYSDTGIARFAALWQEGPPAQWYARHGLDSAAYQEAFDEMRQKGFRPVHVSGYGDGFYPA
jgi:hypothetical protein